MKELENISNSELLEAIAERINGRNGERNRAILRRRLIDGVTYERLAEEFELSPRHIKEIVYKNEYKIFRYIWRI